MGAPYVGVVGVVVEVGGLLNTGGTAERVGKAVFPVKPRTEFDNTAFVRREIEIVGAVEGVQHIEVVGQPPIPLVGECLRGEIGRVDEKTDVGCMDVLCEEFAVVLAGNGEPVEVAVGTEITEADGVVEVLFSECGKIGDVVAAEQDRSREGDVVHEAGAVVAGYRFQHAGAVGLDDAFVARVVVEDSAQFGKDGVGGRDSRETPGVVVEIIVDDTCIGTDGVREMGQQTAASSEIAPQRNALCAFVAMRFLLYQSQKLVFVIGVVLLLQSFCRETAFWLVCLKKM